jgi:bla regulator protein blaR1
MFSADTFSANDFQRNLVLASKKRAASSGRRSIFTGSRIVLPVLLAVSVLAQQASAPLKFEVASIKPSSSDDRRVAMMFQPGGGFRASGATLKMLLAEAYGVREFQISGGPSWISSERFDITAKAERSAASETTPDALQQMTDAERKTMQEQMAQRLQALFADRFQLVVHHERKEQKVYALVVGKNGSKLQQSQGGAGMRQGMMRMGRGSVEGQGVGLEALIRAISGQLGRPVIDRTGLTGRYDIKLQWTPDPGQNATALGGALPPGVEPPPSDPNGPSIFAALQEQLGLRLESEKAPVDLIVIDRVEKPSEN